ncbi:hypothetical protein BH11PLA2_BH11PLA2_42260 [soil metagenome]
MTTTRFFQLCGGLEPLRVAVTAPDGVSTLQTFATPFLRIGSDPKADLVIGLAAPLELALVMVEGHLYALPLDETGTHTAGWVEPGVVLTVGDSTLKVLNPVQSPQRPDLDPLDRDGHPVPAVHFETRGKFRSRKPLEVGPRLLLIGRSEPAKFKINHPAIRLVHAAILRTPSGPWIIDLSLCGETLLNDGTIAAAPLRTGDRVSLAEVELLAQVQTLSAVATVPAAAAPLDSAVGPILQQVALFQQQTFEQFREMLGSMTEMFGSVLNEHRQFVREEFARLERIGTAPLPPGPPAVPQIAPVAVPPPVPVFKAPTPPETVEHIHAEAPGASAPPANAGMHLWVQEQIGTLEKLQSTRWQRLLEKFRGN